MAMGWGRLFGGKRREALVPLYRAVAAAARSPTWYGEGGVPDTLDGRFDMVVAMLSLVLLRLEAEGDAGRAPSAYLTELFVHDMDGQLRQSGIGDIVVGKHVGRMVAALGGRLGALRQAFADGDLDEAIARNIYRGAAVLPEQQAVVRQGLIATKEGLDAQSLERLMSGTLT
ncbi:ubiquinol-cytochrome C chaperone family protein [uncultured Sphingomonas sp.]|uniref:ubiquinol-cytochrome C chaperone family protein n=1 Tax=uncultured Sphingomonas sp. TaxID=158754 RepID=UPI002600C455|nr:ubiquinol-cytochrome C chaperone family protein [uncultured Sphingomonas sp.]